jgi:hypothetical protein
MVNMFESVGKCLSLKTTINKKTKKHESIIVEFEKNELTLTAYGDCCSYSWFERMPEDRRSVGSRSGAGRSLLLNASEEFPEQLLQSLIGKTVIDLKKDTKEIDMPDSNIQEVDRNHVYEFHLDNGTIFEFLFRNSSNGYYDGYIDTKWKYNTHTNAQIPPSAQLIVVIGMPGCGKTTYIKNNYTPLKIYADKTPVDESDDFDTYHFFDDYLEYPMKIHTHIMPLLLKGCSVIVADPRLCDRHVFQREIIETFTSFVMNQFSDKIPRPNLLNIKKQLCVIKFRDHAYQSILNIIHREKGPYHETSALEYIKSIINIDESYKTHFNKYSDIQFGRDVCKWIDIDTWTGSSENL